jgi:AraC-like DNA-binding protein
MKLLLKKYLRWNDLKFNIHYVLHSEERGDCPHHCHGDFYELVVVREGSAVQLIGGRRLPIDAGCVFLVPPGVRHHYEMTADLGIYNILFSTDFLRDFQRDMSGIGTFQLLFGMQPEAMLTTGTLRIDDRIFPEVVRLLDEMIDEERRDQPGSRTAVFSAGLRVFLLICRNSRPPETGRGATRAYRISTVMAAIDERFDEVWSLDRMARMAGMSTSSFRQQFRQLTGVPPIEYLLRLRLGKAAEMLNLPDKSVGEIALACGFADSNYFSRQFRRLYGRSPRAHRH